MPSAIEQSLEERYAWRKAKTEGNKFGLRPGLTSIEEFTAFIDRVKTSSKLKAALEEARSNDVTVFTDISFNVFEEGVNIDIKTSDEKIVKFLIGK